MGKLTQNEFLERAKKSHGDKYDYSKVVYVNSKAKVCIICPIHGEFWQKADAHMNGKGCPTCGHEKVGADNREKDIINKFKKAHGDKFDYSKVKYVNNNTKVDICCPIHGWFKVIPIQFIKGVYGCPECWNDNRNTARGFPIDIFLQKAKQIHGDKYDYSLVSYKTTKDKVKIICPTHGIFEQEANSHIRGVGCPYCKRSKGEDKINKILTLNNINFVQQYKIQNESIFCDNKGLFVDFYIPSLNTIIEYQGAQHYKPVKFWGGIDGYNKQVERDFAVRQYCKEHKIKLIEIPYTEYDNIEEILTKELNIKKHD